MAADSASSQPLTFDEFAAAGMNAWREEAERGLKGASFEKKLISRTPEGIDLQPIYGPGDTESLTIGKSFPGLAPFRRGATASGYTAESWGIAQALPYGLAKDFNEAARHDVAQGQTNLRLSLDRAGRLGRDPDLARSGEVGFCGTSIASMDDLAAALEDLHESPLQLEPGSAGLPLLALWVAVRRRSGKDLANVEGVLGNDPIGELLTDGSLPLPFDAAMDQMALVTRWTVEHMPRLRTINVRAHACSDAGGHAVQELAFALATGVEYLRQMTARGLTVNEVASRMQFAFSMGSDFFMALGKVRAARILWQRIVAVAGGSEDAQKMRIHARTALWNKTKLDPYVNMLRNTTEACAAVMGGCDSLQVGAFDEVVRPPDEFSRRIARNTQVILREECRLDRVIDPAGGSWFVESLTDQLANKAWSLFQEVEKQGGMLKSLRAGFPQGEIDHSGTAKAGAIKQRRSSLIGTNVYANPTEQPLETRDLKLEELQKRRASEVARHRTSTSQIEATALLERLGRLLEAGPDDVAGRAIEAAAHGATLGELWRTLRHHHAECDPPVVSLPLRRGSRPFEQLREAVAGHPKGQVFLAGMGPLRQHKIRADFATSFFQAGGFRMIAQAGFDTAEAAAAAALASPAPIVVICSTDETYPDLVPPLARAIKAEDPQRLVVVAGNPGAHLESFRGAGVDDFIHIRTDCHEMLKQLASRLGLLS